MVSGMINYYLVATVSGSVTPEEGIVTVGHVDKVVAGSHLLVSMPKGCGRLDITETADNYQPDPFQTVLEGAQLIR